MTEDLNINRDKIYTELETPIHDKINLDSTFTVIKAVEAFPAQRDSVLKRIANAIRKYKN
jgi:hypothetical protein